MKIRSVCQIYFINLYISYMYAELTASFPLGRRPYYCACSAKKSCYCYVLPFPICFLRFLDSRFSLRFSFSLQFDFLARQLLLSRLAIALPSVSVLPFTHFHIRLRQDTQRVSAHTSVAKVYLTFIFIL